MNIVHAVESLDPSHGGPAVSAPSLAAAQAELGHTVTLVCYAHDSGFATSNIDGLQFPGFKKLRIEELALPGKAERLLARRATSEFERLAAHTDVLHIHGIWRPFVLAAARVAIRRGVKLVIAPRGMLDPWSLRQHRWRKAVFLRAIWRNVLNRAHFIHALNRDEAELIKPLRLKSPVSVYPNGIFAESFSVLRPDASSFRDRFPALRGRRYIIFLGRLHYKKGIDYLIDAFALFSKQDEQTDLVVAGPDDGVGKELHRRVQSSGIGSRVHILGPIYGPEKFSALAGADCFCLPSRQEGFSMASIEALACGVPVILSQHCHFPEVAEAGAGSVVSLDAGAIAAALADLTHNRDRLRQASLAARMLALTRYDWPKIAESIIRGYECGSAPRASGTC